MNWVQLAYQYGIGGAFFLITLFLCTRPGTADWNTPSDRRSIVWLIAGLVGYFIMHVIWILLAS